MKQIHITRKSNSFFEFNGCHMALKTLNQPSCWNYPTYSIHSVVKSGERRPLTFLKGCQVSLFIYYGLKLWNFGCTSLLIFFRKNHLPLQVAWHVYRAFPTFLARLHTPELILRPQEDTKLFEFALKYTLSQISNRLVENQLYKHLKAKRDELLR